MPYKTFGCSICGKQAPKRLREHGTMDERMEWLRHHRKHEHPEAFTASVKKSAVARRKKGEWSLEYKKPKSGRGMVLEFKMGKKKAGRKPKGSTKTTKKSSKKEVKVSKVSQWDSALYKKYMQFKNKLRGR